MSFERLEARELLASDFQNTFLELDVNDDGFVGPLDVLVVVNDLNTHGARQLVPPAVLPVHLVDVNGNGFSSPVDALVVINALNAGGAATFVSLVEVNQFNHEAVRSLTLPAIESGTRSVRFDVATRVATTDSSAAVEDQLLVYLVQSQSPGQTLLPSGAPGAPVFSLVGGRADFPPGLVQFDGRTVQIETSSLAGSSTAALKFQYINSDGDVGGRAVAKRISVVTSPDDQVPFLPAIDAVPPADSGQPLDLLPLQPTAEIELEFTDFQFATAGSRYATELRAKARTAGLGRDVAVVFTGLPASVSLVNASGSTPAGDPYINLREAITAGGLAVGARTAPIRLEFLNPQRVPFGLRPLVLAGVANRPPQLAPLDPLHVMPGGVLEVALAADDPDGDPVAFTLLSPSPSPPIQVRPDGRLTIRPRAGQEGTYELEAIATDGVASVSQRITLNVVADPLATTRVSGRVLRTTGAPLEGVVVEIGEVQSITLADGSFTIDLGGGPPVADTLKIRAERLAGAETFPFIAEKLELLLEREVEADVNNVVARPIYLPALDVANGQAIDPDVDVTVTSAAIPEAAVFVRAGTLLDQQGNAFQGTLSITEVPADFTPAALPSDLFPDLVVTIQPGEMVFTAPAPLTLPNLGGFPAAAAMELWSINPITGDFDRVGSGRVSDDGSRVETIEGGIRNSSWHFFTPAPQRANNPNRNARNQSLGGGCDECGESFEATSSVDAHSGVLRERHQLVAYQSVGRTRAAELHYHSFRADPRPIVHFDLEEVVAREGDRLIAKLKFRRGDIEQAVPGFVPPPPFLTVRRLTGGEHFWTVPAGLNHIEAALQADLTQHPTGVYDFEVEFGVRTQDNSGNFVGNQSSFVRQEIVVNRRTSPFGAGWDLAGLAEVIANPDGTVLLVEGSGVELLFTPSENAPDLFDSPAADVSLLERLPDGTLRRTGKDGTQFQFDATGRLATMRDRNGNLTVYGYDGGGRLASITDPAGLVTQFVSSGDRIRMIVDPAGRTTNLTHDDRGNLIRITDPDGASRSFEYDEHHRLIAEVDQRGFREEAVYGFHGRVEEVLRKDGSGSRFQPVQTVGLFPVERTLRPFGSLVPSAVIVNGPIQAQVVDPRGNATGVQLNQAGEAVGARDGLGLQAQVARNEHGLPVRTTDARGNVVQFTYDERGNLLRIEDEIHRRGSGDLLFAGRTLHTMGRAVLTVGDLNGDGIDDLVSAARLNGRLHLQTRLGLVAGGWSEPRDITTTQDVTAEALTLGDFTGDGLADLVTVNQTNNSLSLFDGDGAGGFTFRATLAAGTSPVAAALGDLNGDNRLDLVVGNISASLANNLSVRLGTGGGGFAAPAALNAADRVRALALVDVNGDNQLDIVVAGGTLPNGKLATFPGNGDGTFAVRQDQSLGAEPTSLAIADLDGDQRPDAVVGKRATTISVLPGGADGQFQARVDIPVPDGLNAQGVAIGDMDADGLPDLVLALATNDLQAFSLRMLLAAGNLQFVPGSPRDLPRDSRRPFLAHVDRDGRLDAVVEGRNSHAVSLVGNQGGGVFRDPLGNFDPTDLPANPRPTLIAAGDLDRDGVDDLVVALDNRTVSILFGNGQTARDLAVPSGNGSDDPAWLAVIDVTGDELLDIVIGVTLSRRAEVVVLPGLGNGNLGAPVNSFLGDFFVSGGADGLLRRPHALADLDADGDLDLVFQIDAQRFGIALGDGAGHFVAQPLISLNANQGLLGLAAGDVDGDTDPDLLLLVRDPTSSIVQLRRNDGQGILLPPETAAANLSGLSEGDLVAVDLDRDGHLDVAATLFQGGRAGRSAIHILYGDGGGTFGDARLFDAGSSEFTGPPFRTNLIAADLDQDQLPDLVVPNVASSTVSIVRNGPGRQWTGDLDYFAGRTPTQVVALDRDQDGDPELAVANFLPGEDGVALLENVGLLAALPNAGARVFEYEPVFNRQIRAVDDLGREIRYMIDPANGNILAEIRVVGELGGGDDLVSQFEYDARGQLTAEIDAAGRRTESHYDAAGRLVRVVFAAGTPQEAVALTQYDAAGNVIAVTDENGHRTEFTYDARNRLIQTRDALGGISTITYDAAGNQTSTTDARGHVTRFEYDSLGRLVRTIDPSGAVVGRSYDASGNLTELTDPLGRVHRFRYDARNRLVESIDPAGGVIRRQYDQDNNLIAVTDAAGRVTRHTYDPRNRLTAIRDPLGGVYQTIYDAADQVVGTLDALNRLARREYDELGRMVREIDPLGGTTVLTYDAAGNVLTTTDPLGHTTHFTYDERNRVVEVVDPLGGVASSRYDAAGNLVETTDVLGNVTAYAYDALRRQISQTDALGQVTLTGYDAVGNVIARTDARGNTTQFEYDAQGNLGKSIDPLGGVVEWTRNAVGQVLAVEDELGRVTRSAYDELGNLVAFTDALGHVTRYDYDAAGNQVRTIDPLGRATGFAYDPLNRLVTRTDALGGVTTRTYDLVGNLIAEQDPRGSVTVSEYDSLNRLRGQTSADGGTTRFEYDANSQLTRTTDPLGQVTARVYDPLGRLVTETDPLGRTSHFSYDPIGNMVATTNPAGETAQMVYDALHRRTHVTDPAGLTVTTTYDAVGNPIAVQDTGGGIRLAEFDARNRLVQATDPLGGVVAYQIDLADQILAISDQAGSSAAYEYDAVGRRVASTDALGNTARAEFDAVGNLVARTDPAGNRTAFVYDALNRQVRATDARGSETRQTYDPGGKLLEVRDANGHVTRFEYDAVGRLIRETNPLGGVRQFAYDLLGRVIAKTDRLGRRTEFQYDAAGQLTGEDWFEPGNPAPIHSIQTTFDDAGRVTAIQDAFGSYQYTYDAAGRLAAQHNAGTPGVPVVEHQFTYGGNNRVASVTEIVAGIAAATTQVLYDANLRIVGLRQSGPNVAEKRVDYQYDPAGRFGAVARFSDLAGTQLVATTQFAFDAGGRLTGLAHEQGPLVLYEASYVHDANNRIIRRQSSHGISQFEYDPSGQLVSASHDFQDDERYAYDPAGNRLGADVEIGPNNQLNEAGRQRMEYDAEGNRVRQTDLDTGEFLEFTYDHRNRLTAVERRDGGGGLLMSAQYAYDALNRRLRKRVSASGLTEEQHYVHETTYPTLVFDGQGNLLRRSLSGSLVDEVLAEETPSGVLWRLTDRHGSVTEVLDQAGALVDHVDYDSFGNATHTAGASVVMATYTGRQFDPESGLYYLRNRYLDPVFGRFIQEDPLGFFAGDGNLSRYVGNDPVNHSDPLGLAEDKGFFGYLGDFVSDASSLVVNTIGSAVQTVSEGVDYVLGDGAFDIVAQSTYGVTTGVSNAATFGLFDYAREAIHGDQFTHSAAFQYGNLAGEVGFSLLSLGVGGVKIMGKELVKDGLETLVRNGDDLVRAADAAFVSAVNVARNSRYAFQSAEAFKQVDQLRRLAQLNKAKLLFAQANLVGQPARGLLQGLGQLFGPCPQQFGVTDGAFLLLNALGLRYGIQRTMQTAPAITQKIADVNRAAQNAVPQTGKVLQEVGQAPRSADDVLRELDEADAALKAKETAERERAAREFFDKLDQEHAARLQQQQIDAKAQEVDDFFRQAEKQAEVRDYFRNVVGDEGFSGGDVPARTGDELAQLDDLRAQQRGFANAAEDAAQFRAIVNEMNERLRNARNGVEHNKLFDIFDPAISNNNNFRPGDVREIVDEIQGLKAKPRADIQYDIVPGGADDLDADFFGGGATDLPDEFF